MGIIFRKDIINVLIHVYFYKYMMYVIWTRKHLYVYTFQMQPGPSGTDKSGSLTYTENYVFNNADILGKGATATVFLGRHRVSF